MCKIKDAIQRAQEVKQYYYWNFMESLYEMMPEQPKLTIEDIEEMEKSYYYSSNPTCVNSDASISSSSLNNQFYEPKEDNYYAK